MKSIFINSVAVALLLLTGATFAQAQDTVKKPVVTKPAAIKPTVVKPGLAKPGYVNPYTKYHTYNKAGVAQANGVHADTTGGTVPKQPYAYAAANDSALLKDKSLNGQYQYFLTKILRYQQPLASALWKNFTDSLNTSRKKLKDAQATVSTQNKTISDMQANARALAANTTGRTDYISMFGLNVDKGVYNWIMWGLVVVFGAVATVVIIRSGVNKYEAGYRTKLYNELEEEYKAFKTKANGKEKKLARELQTERNKLDELLGRG